MNGKENQNFLGFGAVGRESNMKTSVLRRLSI